MTSSPSRWRRQTLAASALLTATLVPGLLQLPAIAGTPSLSGAASSTAPAADEVDLSEVRTLGDPVHGLEDLDARGTALPSAAQRSAVARLGVADVRWNRFGTPSSLLPTDGSLAAATAADPVVAARTWLSRNAAAFGLTSTQVAALDVVSSQPFAMSDARAVLFRQRFGNLTPALASMVTVGVANGEIAYASSSISKTTGTPAAPTLTPLEGWL